MYITSASLGAYAKVAVPLSSRRYHVKRRYGWGAEKYKDGSWKALDRYALRRHVLGTYQVAVRWHAGQLVQHAVIDLDSPPKNVAQRTRGAFPHLVVSSDRLMYARLQQVLAAFQNPPHVIIRSSTSRGPHVYFFFDKPYPGDDVRAVLHATLKAAGLPPNGTVVDKIFPSNQALRLPLGRGSCILEERGGRLQPLFAREVPWRPLPQVAASYAAAGAGEPPAGVYTLLRDVEASPDAFVDMANAARIPLHRLGSAHGGVVGKVVAATSVRAAAAPGSSVPRHQGRGGEALAQAGTRHRQSREFLAFRWRAGIDRVQALTEYRAWLYASAVSGTSKQLAGAITQTLDWYEQEGAAYWKWMTDHWVHPPVHAQAGTRFIAVSLAAGLTRTGHQHTLSTTPTPAWSRTRALAEVTLEDERLLQTVESAWLRKKLKVMSVLSVVRAEGRTAPST